MTQADGPPGPALPRIPVREAPPPKTKRFYKEVSVALAEESHRVLLDGRPVKTPLRRSLEASTAALAEAIAQEWRDQADEIDPVSMPLTRLAATAVDRVGPERDAIVRGLLAYVATDLLCYRAPHPTDLKARQDAIWQPVLDWLETRHGVALKVVYGILPADHPPGAAAAAEHAVRTLPDTALTALQAAVAATGSLALGLALVHGRLGSTEVIAAAELDETYQNEMWGEDAEAMRRRAALAADVEAVGRYLRLLGA